MTTIHPPRLEQIQSYVTRGYHLVVAGDSATPSSWTQVNDNDVTYLDLDEQAALFPDLNKRLPTKSYARKNIGYLYAIKNLGCTDLLETDDDTFLSIDPFEVLVKSRIYGVTAVEWPNPYSLYFGGEFWPRGFPLDEVQGSGQKTRKSLTPRLPSGRLSAFPSKAPSLVQFMVANEPDLDAICRLTVSNYDSVEMTSFDGLVELEANQYGIGNTQNTLWLEGFDPTFLYFPHSVPMRYADILKMHISQRAHCFMYGPATAVQHRNVHVLMDDFSDELDLYLHTKNDAVALRENGKSTVTEAYTALARLERIDPSELNAVNEFVEALRP